MSLFGTGRKEGVCAVLLLVAVALFQHAPGVLWGSARGAIDPAAVATGRGTSGDLTAESATNQVVLLPAMQQAGAVLREGSWPTWNPYSRFGEPFAVTDAPVFYPPFWLFMLPDGDRYLDLVMLLHSALACVLAYRMLRVLTVSRYSGFLGAGLFGLGWFLTTAHDRLPEAAAAAWLPWIVTSSRRMAFATNRSPHAVSLAIAMVVPFLTGGTGTATAGVALAIGCMLGGLLAIDRADRPQVAAASLLGGGLALLLSAPLWLMALANAPALSVDVVDANPRLQVAGLAALLVPGLFGELGGGAPPAMASANPGADGLELALYPGALTLFVALMGLIRPKRTLLALFWLLIAGGCLLLSLDGPLAELVRPLAPWTYLRPGSWLAVFHLSTVVLVALGTENFFDAPRARRLAVPVVASLVAAASVTTLVLAWLWPAAATPIASALLGELDDGELMRATQHIAAVSIIPAAASLVIAALFLTWRPLGILRFKPLLAVAAFGELCLLSLLYAPRVERTIDPSYAAMLPADGERVIRAGEPDLPPANWLAGRDGVRAVDTTGNGILARTARYLESIEPGIVTSGRRTLVGPIDRQERLDDPLVVRAGVTATLASRTPTSLRFMPLTAVAMGEATSNRMQPFVTPVVTPRVRIAYVVETVTGPDTANRQLHTTHATLGDAVLIELERPEFQPARPAEEPTIDVIEDRPDRFQARVDMHDGRGYLVIADAIAPGWRATVDGQSVTILAADVAFRAVPLHEGVHEVVFAYRPTGLVLGIALSLFGAMLACAVLVYAALMRRRPTRRHA